MGLRCCIYHARLVSILITIKGHYIYAVNVKHGSLFNQVEISQGNFTPASSVLCISQVRKGSLHNLECFLVQIDIDIGLNRSSKCPLS